MKKLLSLFIVPLLLVSFVQTISAQSIQVPGPNHRNSYVYHYDKPNQDLLVALDEFPVYFLINLSGSECTDVNFPQHESLKVDVNNISTALIIKTDSNEGCSSDNGGVQIQGDFRLLNSVDAQNSTLRTLDEDGNIHEIKHGPGCGNALSKIGQPVYLGTGWHEDMLFLAGNAGKCRILESNLISTKQ